MEVVSPTLYVTVQLVEDSLILHFMLTVVLVESLHGTSTILDPLSRQTIYYIWVRAVLSGGQGPYSDRRQNTTYNGMILTCHFLLY